MDVEGPLRRPTYQALAIQVAERTREIERRRLVAESLRDVLTVLNSGRPLDEVLDHVLAQAGRLLGSDGCAIYLTPEDSDGGTLAVRASSGLAPDLVAAQVRVGSPVTGLAYQRRRPVACADILAAFGDPAMTPGEMVIEDHTSHLTLLRAAMPDADPGGLARVRRLGTRFPAALSVPLHVKHEVYGAISFYFRECQDFTAEEIALATAVGDQAALAVESARLRAQAEQRTRDLEALYRADEMLHRSLRLGDVLQALVDVAADILGSDKASVLVWDERRERLIVGASRGFSPLLAREVSVTPGQGVVGRVAVTGVAEGVEDVADVVIVMQEVVVPEGIRSFMHVPVMVNDQVFGIFNVNYTQPRTFGASHRRLLLALAQRAALAIENARLFEQAQEAATFEERQRLARELHDAVTQTLFSASLIAEAIPRLWERNVTEARRRLDELRRLTRGALAEMRGLLLELRPSALAEAPLPDLLVQLAEAMAGRAHLPVAVTVDGASGSAPPLPPDVHLALYRVAQEALNNVAQHAGASRATVHLRCAPAAVELTIGDDGRGFNPEVTVAGHFGTGIMRERAAAIGATFTLHSRPGEGTVITVHWPVPADLPDSR